MSITPHLDCVEVAFPVLGLLVSSTFHRCLNKLLDFPQLDFFIAVSKEEGRPWYFILERVRASCKMIIQLLIIILRKVK